MRIRPATSRWKASAISFGPIGRIAATVLALLPVWWLLGANLTELALRYEVGYFLGACAYSGLVIPLILRDVWKRVPDRGAAPTLELPPEPAAYQSVLERDAPTRW
jgi:hypothetical protein